MSAYRQKVITVLREKIKARHGDNAMRNDIRFTLEYLRKTKH